MQTNPLEQVLEEYSKTRSELGITLRDGSYIKGMVKDYDGYVILLDGVPDTIVYRHSILKLAAAGAGPQRRTAPAPEKRVTPPRKEPSGRPSKPRPENPPVKEPAASQGGLGVMGEAMLRWLERQKGGE